MAVVISELVWISHLLQNLQISVLQPAVVYCDNQSAIAIANNPTFHDNVRVFSLFLLVVSQNMMWFMSLKGIFSVRRCIQIEVTYKEMSQSSGSCSDLSLEIS